MNNLLIVGNGFDLAHGMKTRFDDFVNSNGIYEDKYNEFSSEDGSWNSIECNIEKLVVKIVEERNYVDVSDETSDIILQYGTNKYGDYEYYGGSLDIYDDEIESLRIYMQLVNNFEEDFKKYLIELCSEDLNKSVTQFDNVLNLVNHSSYIINFNYTHTLEEVYDCKEVIHIHGDINDNILIGYGSVDSLKESYIDATSPDDTLCRNKYDLQERLTFSEYEEMGSKTKDLFGLIEEEIGEKEESIFNAIEIKNKNNFDIRKNAIKKLHETIFDTVYIIGHSLGNADYDVFDSINKDTEVVCFYHEKDERDKFADTFKKLGLKYELVKDIALFK